MSSIVRGAEQAVILAQIYAKAKGGNVSFKQPPPSWALREVRLALVLNKKEFAAKLGISLYMLRKWSKQPK